MVHSCHPLSSISHGQERPAVGLCYDFVAMPMTVRRTAPADARDGA
jgi:hypothetical protein